MDMHGCEHVLQPHGVPQEREHWVQRQPQAPMLPLYIFPSRQALCESRRRPETQQALTHRTLNKTGRAAHQQLCRLDILFVRGLRRHHLALQPARAVQRKWP